jgi:hypothetical protein
MEPFFELTPANITTIFGYMGGAVSDAMPFVLIAIGISLGIIIVSFIIDLF